MCKVAGSSTIPARNATIVSTMPTPCGAHQNASVNHTGFPTIAQFISAANGDAIKAREVESKDIIRENTNVPKGKAINKLYSKAVAILLSFKALNAFAKNPPST